MVLFIGPVDSPLLPERPIERSVVDGFAEVVAVDVVAGGEVGDGAADAEDFVVGSGGQAHLFHRRLQQRFGVGFQFAVFADLGRGHAAVQSQRVLAEATLLHFSRGLHVGLHLLAAGSDRLIGELPEGDWGDFDMDIQAIEQWAADPTDIAFDLQRVAFALPLRIAAITAGAGVHCGDQHDVGGEGQAAHRTADRDRAVFQRLTQHFQCPPIELGQFIQEQHPILGFHGTDRFYKKQNQT